MSDTGERTEKSAIPHSSVPGTGSHLPFGNAVSLAVKRLRFMQQLRARGDIVRVRLAGTDYYAVNSPELLRTVLVTDADKFDRGRLFVKGRAYAGNGIATSDGDFHLRQRRLMNPAFHVNRLPRYAEIMSSETARMTRDWHPGDIVKFDHQMHELSCSIAARALFRSELTESDIDSFAGNLRTIVRGVMVRTVLPDYYGRIPTPGNRRFDAACTNLRALVDGVVTSYLAEDADHGDLLSMLVATRDETGQRMTSTQLLDEVVTILMAATETTASTLSWACYELDRHPEITRRVVDEVDTVTGGRAVEFEHVQRMPYLRQVISETLRRHTPTWLFMRRANRDVTLGSAHIPQGAELMYSLTALHRDPTWYPDPDRFNPDRFAQADNNVPFLPFGGGRHRCIGEHFAMTEMAVVLATILGSWRLRLAAGRPIHEVTAAVVRPNRLPVIVQPRA